MSTIIKVDNVREVSSQVRDSLITEAVVVLMKELRERGYEDANHIVETAVWNYLNSEDVCGKIIVKFIDEHEMMPCKHFKKVSMLTVEDDICLELEESTDKAAGGHYVLYACVQKNKEVLKERENQKRWEKFCQRFADNKDVAPLLNEVRSKLDVSKPVFFRLVPKKWWFSEYEREANPVVFLGQTPNLKTRSFVPNKPIGYVVDNKVCVAVSCKAFKDEKFTI